MAPTRFPKPDRRLPPATLLPSQWAEYRRVVREWDSAGREWTQLQACEEMIRRLAEKREAELFP